MNKLQLTALSCLLVTAGSLQAAPCDGYEIAVTNNTVDTLVNTTAHLDHGKITPNGIHRVKGKTTQVFMISQTATDIPLNGKLVFHTVGIPSKKIKIRFDLANGATCIHNDHSIGNVHNLDVSYAPNRVNYIITK